MAMVAKTSEPLDERVHILQEHGFLCHIKAHTRLELPPRQAFEIIADPDNARIFRSIEECTYRKVLYEKQQKQRVAVEHQSGWKFLWHKGQFATKLLVEQDNKAMVMAFRLAESGFMKNFEGFWRMEPVPGDPEATIAVLHQNVLPVVYMPGLNWALTKICKAQIETLLHDVHTEVDRIKTGKPIPRHQEEKMKGKRSWVQPPVNGFKLDLSSDSDTGSWASGPDAEAAPDAPRDAEDASPPSRHQSSEDDQWPLLEAAKHNMISAKDDEVEQDAPGIG